MKLGFIGLGVVGGAVMKAFEQGYRFECLGYDKFKAGHANWDDLIKFGPEAIFVSVPTATSPEGHQDIGPLLEVCQRLKGSAYAGLVIIKCTVLPGTCDQLAEQFKLRIVHNPEFLTARSPLLDFVGQKTVLLSGEGDDTLVAHRIYRSLLERTPIERFTSRKVTEFAKYLHNTFLAAKVSFMNEFSELCTGIDAPFWQVRLAAEAMGGIGKTHTEVPGPDGKPGYAGMCFPKDTEALLTFAVDNECEMPVLEAAVESNYKRRPDAKIVAPSAEAKRSGAW